MAAPYRTAPTQRFELRGGKRVWLSAVLMATTLVVSLAVAAVYPGILILAVSTPALVFLLSGGPLRIDISPGHVVISYWMRRTRTIATPTLQLQEMEDELVFIDGEDTFCIETELFEPGDAHRCAAAIRAVTARSDQS